MDKEESSKHGRKIADIDADAEVNLENVYNLDMAHEETVLSMQDVTDADVKEVAKEMIEVITTAKIIVDEVSIVGGELNSTNEEPISAKGIVFHYKEESTTRTTSLKSQAKDKGKAKLVEEPEILKSRKAQIAIDEEVLRRIEAELDQYLYLNKGPEIDAEMIKAPRKRTRKEKVEKDQTTKKQKGDELEQDNAKKQKLEEQEEVEELKKNLEIVPNDEDDVFVNVIPLSSNPPTIVDYKIYNVGKREEDLEVLCKIVKDRFKKSQPKEVLDVFLWHTLR
nr:hypothetical protein [Tanacetum cinerariifolium]